MDFTRRSNEAEWMDTEIVEADDFAQCLADLANVNVVTLARRPTLSWLEEIATILPPGHTLSILDVGFGQGDMLRAIWHWSRRRGIRVDLHGVDLNPLSAYAASRATPSDMAIDFRSGDVFATACAQRFDVIISSLLAHHLTDAQIVNFIRLMEHQTVIGWFINDLHRHAIAYHAFKFLAMIAGWHRFVLHDGPISVARSFRRRDWQEFLRQADTDGDIRWRFPFRYCVGRVKRVRISNAAGGTP